MLEIIQVLYSNLTLEYISEGQPSPLELIFGVGLGFSHYSF